MNPTTYTLCAKPVIGAMMWIASLCTFPPPLPQADVSLASAGAVLAASFEIPVEKSYPLILTFAFAGTDERLQDRLVGSAYDEHCDGRPYAEIPQTHRDRLGRPIPLRVIVRKADDGPVVLDRTFESLCATGWVDARKDRIVGHLPLPRGRFSIEVVNLQPQPGFERVKIGLTLAGGTGK